MVDLVLVFGLPLSLFGLHESTAPQTFRQRLVHSLIAPNGRQPKPLRVPCDDALLRLACVGITIA
jgi:hypothetical protein